MDVEFGRSAVPIHGQPGKKVYQRAPEVKEQTDETPAYPTIVSANRADRTPIPWAALSGLASRPYDLNTMSTVYDSYFAASRIFAVDISAFPARITGDIVLRDGDGDTVDLDPEGIFARPRGLG